MNFFKLHRNAFFILISIIISIPFVICFGLNGDEAFTMGMVNLSYSSIIHATSLDIHPPLYYILLKSFLSLTTFWTSSIFIKIIFSRILSAFISILTFYFILQILKITKITYNKYLYFLIFLLFPLQLGWEQQFTNIRMYSLSTLLFAIEVYFVTKYLMDYKNINIVIITISTLMSMYTNYICGLISGTFLIVVLVDVTIKKDFKQAKNIILSGISSIILFLPWIPNLLNQLSLTKYDTAMTLHSLIRFLVIVAGIVFVFMLPRLFNRETSSKYMIKIRCYLYITLAITLIVIIIIKPNAISLRYVAPVITLIMFVDSLYYLHSKSLYSNKKIRIFLVSFFGLFLLSNYYVSVKNQIANLDLPSYRYLRTFKKVESSNQKSINAKRYGLTKYPWNAMGGNAIYLQSINKRINDEHYVNVYNSLGNGNEKLFKTIYYNIDHPYRKHF